MPISISSPAADAIRVPRDALRYVLFQRTDYLALPRHRLLYRLLHKLTPGPTIRTVVTLEAACRAGHVRRRFNLDMAREYEEIRSHLPAHAAAILDIGCGVGGIDVLLYRHYRTDGPQLYLLDKTATDTDLHYGFEGSASFYNSLEATERTLLRNGVPHGHVHLREARADGLIDVRQPLDLVLSLISWGFHYPVSVYARQVHRLLREGGRAILDVRRGTGGEEELRRLFRRVDLVSESAKKRRLAATR